MKANNYENIQEFNGDIETAIRLVEDLAQALEDHLGFEPDDIGETEAGDAGQLVDDLRQLLNNYGVKTEV
jgi:hypothetical protein